MYFFFFFFFSSRRRHTRSDRDWSSDVCSSDLAPAGAPVGRGSVRGRAAGAGRRRGGGHRRDHHPGGPSQGDGARRTGEGRGGEEGRIRGWPDHLKKKKKKKGKRDRHV